MLLHNPKLRLDRVRPDDREHNTKKREKEQKDQTQPAADGGSTRPGGALIVPGWLARLSAVSEGRSTGFMLRDLEGDGGVGLWRPEACRGPATSGPLNSGPLRSQAKLQGIGTDAMAMALSPMMIGEGW